MAKPPFDIDFFWFRAQAFDAGVAGGERASVVGERGIARGNRTVGRDRIVYLGRVVRYLFGFVPGDAGDGDDQASRGNAPRDSCVRF